MYHQGIDFLLTLFYNIHEEIHGRIENSLLHLAAKSPTYLNVRFRKYDADQINVH